MTPTPTSSPTFASAPASALPAVSSAVPTGSALGRAGTASRSDPGAGSSSDGEVTSLASGKTSHPGPHQQRGVGVVIPDRPPLGPWAQHANCLGVDPSLFFPTDGDVHVATAAKAVCRGCEVRAECLDYAVTNYEVHGIWGATSERERRRIRKQRRGAA